LAAPALSFSIALGPFSLPRLRGPPRERQAVAGGAAAVSLSSIRSRGLNSLIWINLKSSRQNKPKTLEKRQLTVNGNQSATIGGRLLQVDRLIVLIVNQDGAGWIVFQEESKQGRGAASRVRDIKAFL
jgi:hypothetical protein